MLLSNIFRHPVILQTTRYNILQQQNIPSFHLNKYQMRNDFDWDNCQGFYFKNCKYIDLRVSVSMQPKQ